MQENKGKQEQHFKETQISTIQLKKLTIMNKKKKWLVNILGWTVDIGNMYLKIILI